MAFEYDADGYRIGSREAELNRTYYGANPGTPETLGQKWRGIMKAFGVDQTPVDPNDTTLGSKVRAGFGAAPMAQPTAVQADVRKADLAAAEPTLMERAKSWFAGGATPTATEAVPTVTSPAAGSPMAAPGFQSQVRAVDNAIAPPLYPNGAPVTAMTAADIRGTTIPAAGTGGFVNERTGAVTLLDSREAPGGPGATPPGYVPGSVGSYIGAVMNQRRAAQTEGRQLAAQKLMVEGLGKGATAAHSAAQAAQVGLQTRAAVEHLRLHPGDYAGASAVAGGRPVPKDSFSIPFPPMDDKGPVVLLNKGTGAVEKRMPVTPITMAAAVASARKNGTYRSDAQVRADIAKIPGYKLTD